MVQTWSLVTVSQSIKSFTSSVRCGWIFSGDCHKFTAEYDSRELQGNGDDRNTAVTVVIPW